VLCKDVTKLGLGDAKLRAVALNTLRPFRTTSGTFILAIQADWRRRIWLSVEGIVYIQEYLRCQERRDSSTVKRIFKCVSVKISKMRIHNACCSHSLFICCVPSPMSEHRESSHVKLTPPPRHSRVHDSERH
jgi:hypothetical protein